MSYFAPIDSDLFSIVGLGTTQNKSLIEAITEINVSLTLSGSSEVSVTVVDPDFNFAVNNYFQIRRQVIYRGMQFEIAAIETSRSEAVHPQHTLQCRSQKVQEMKRDKQPEIHNGKSGYDLAQQMAGRFGMNFVGERTAKKQAIVKIQNSNTDDSVWSVLQSLAGEQQFICFESENTLFFCSEKFLLGKWGDPQFQYGTFRVVPYVWPEPSANAFPTAKDKYILMDIPTIRRSDDDINAASGAMVVERFNGVNLRPGMTVHIEGIPSFSGPYIISDVSFNEGEPDPIQVQFRTPIEPKPETTTGGGTGTGGSGTSSLTGSQILQNFANQLVANNITVPFPVNTLKALTSSQTTTVRNYAAEWLARIFYSFLVSGSSYQARQIIYIVVQGVTRSTNGWTQDQVRKWIDGQTIINSYSKRLAKEIWFGFITRKAITSVPLYPGLSPTQVQQLKTTYLNA